MGSITVRKAWVSGESSLVIKDSPRPGHPHIIVIFVLLCSYGCNFCNLLYGLFYKSQIILIPFDNFYTACVCTVSACCSHFTAIVHQLTCFCKSQVSPYPYVLIVALLKSCFSLFFLYFFLSFFLHYVYSESCSVFLQTLMYLPSFGECKDLSKTF